MSKQAKKDSYSIGSLVPYVLIHLLPIGAFFTGIGIGEVVLLFAYYFVGMLFVVIGYHRYFSHRAFKTNRFFQFLLAFGAQMTAQKGVLWWAANHRHHHKYSDAEEDVHSPKQKGFWYSHVGWVLSNKHLETDYQMIKDYAKYPELIWLNKYNILPAWILGFAIFFIGGASYLFFSFFMGIVLIWHATYTINSLSHVFGKKRYVTRDTSKNNWFLALLTFGEGWHNNHHYYMHSARQGFFWYECDIAYYVIKILSWLRVVKDIRPVPEHILKSSWL